MKSTSTIKWLGPKVGGHLAPFLYSSREPSELSQWLCHDDSTIYIFVLVIIIIITIIIIIIIIMIINSVTKTFHNTSFGREHNVTASVLLYG